jgi:hypothetical protein
MFDISKLHHRQSDRILYEVSTYDRDGRNVGDGFYDACYHYIENGEYVVFDEFGPGILVNFWIPLDNKGVHYGTINFLFDDDTVPRISLSKFDLFSGTHRLFPYPLAVKHDSGSGGNYIITPLSFEKRLRVRFTQKPYFYHFLYYRLKEGNGLKSLDTADDFSFFTYLLMPDTGCTGFLKESFSGTIPPGQVIPLFSRDGPGTIKSIRIQAYYDLEFINHLKIIGCWDGADAPQVAVPLGEFFGCRYGITPFQSSLVQVDTGMFYARFPMPFASSGRIYLKNGNNQETIQIKSDIGYSTTLSTDTLLYFNVFCNRELMDIKGRDYPFLSAVGQGHYAGGFLYIRGNRVGNFLEGDERIYVDGRSFPDFYGTGLEDYFLGGWYFKHGPFTLPINGYISSIKGAYDCMSLYRWHISDRIPYLSSIKAGFEKGPTGQSSATYASVGFYYGRGTPHLVLTDSIIIGDTASEDSHALDYGALLDTRPVHSAYAGDSIKFRLLDGKYFKDSVKFSVYIHSQNRGIILRAVTDCGRGGQLIRVFADTVFCGNWSITAENPFLRFYDADFFIPESLTAGKDSLQIRLLHHKDSWSIGFNAFKYEIYSITEDKSNNSGNSYINRCWFRPDPFDGTHHTIFWSPPLDSFDFEKIAVYRDTTDTFKPSINNLTGTTFGLSFTDERLSPGRMYYYRFESIGRSGSRKNQSEVFRVRTPGIIQREGETLFPSLVENASSGPVEVHLTFDESGDSPGLPPAPEGLDTIFSNQRFLKVAAEAVNDSATFRLFMNAQDTFELGLTYCMGKHFGVFEAFVNGKPIGIKADAYSDTTAIAEAASESLFVLYPGYNTLTLKSTGKFRKATGFFIGIDRFRLSTLSERYFETPDSLKINIVSCYPNPFNPVVTVKFEVAQDNHILAGVYDLSGRLVRILAQGRYPRRMHRVFWDGKSRLGTPCPSGIYLIRLKGIETVKTIKAVLLR